MKEPDAGLYSTILMVEYRSIDTGQHDGGTEIGGYVSDLQRCDFIVGRIVRLENSGEILGAC